MTRKTKRQKAAAAWSLAGKHAARVRRVHRRVTRPVKPFRYHV